MPNLISSARLALRAAGYCQSELPASDGGLFSRRNGEMLEERAILVEISIIGPAGMQQIVGTILLYLTHFYATPKKFHCCRVHLFGRSHTAHRPCMSTEAPTTVRLLIKLMTRPKHKIAILLQVNRLLIF